MIDGPIMIVDGSTPLHWVLIARREEVLFFTQSATSIPSLIAQGLDACSLVVQDINVVFVGQSPGSRVGTLKATALARGLKRPVFGMNSLRAWATSPLFAIDRRGRGVLVLSEGGEPSYCTIQELNLMVEEVCSCPDGSVTPVDTPTLEALGKRTSAPLREARIDPRRALMLAHQAWERQLPPPEYWDNEKGLDKKPSP